MQPKNGARAEPLVTAAVAETATVAQPCMSAKPSFAEASVRRSLRPPPRQGGLCTSKTFP
eukprot:12065950-Alexandrium_andersonii.AAC.1